MDEREAIRRCRAGDRDAFRYFVEAYQAQALRHALAVLGEAEDARDATQDAFLDAFRALAHFDETRAFYPWFYTMLRNRCFKAIADRRRRRAEWLDDFEFVAPDRGLPPEESLAIERALRGLSAEDREILVLRHFEGLSYDELSSWLDVPSGTVMSRLFYARKRLREALRDPAPCAT